MPIRYEEYILGHDSRNQKLFEKEQVSRAILNLKWTKHIEMGCEETKKGHLEDISALDIDDGDQMLILGSHSGSISVAKYKYLDRKKWKKPISLNLKNLALKSIKWCPLDMRLFMITTTSNWMKACDITKEKVLAEKKFDGMVHFNWNEFDSKSSKVAVADGSRSMKIVDFRVGMSLPQIIRWEELPIDVVQWFPSKHNYVFAGRRDGKIGIFDIRSTRGALVERKIHRSTMFEMKISSDGQRLITADRSGHIHVADTWNFSTKSEHFGAPSPVLHFRPSLEILNNGNDLFVATNLEKLTILKFSEGLRKPEVLEMEQKVLRDKPVIFRKSSYELITGHNYNYLNILSFEKSREYDDEISF